MGLVAPAAEQESNLVVGMRRARSCKWVSPGSRTKIVLSIRDLVRKIEWIRSLLLATHDQMYWALGTHTDAKGDLAGKYGAEPVGARSGHLPNTGGWGRDRIMRCKDDVAWDS